MVSTKKNRRLIIIASFLGAVALTGSLIVSENPGNLLRLNAGESESRWSKSLTFDAADLVNGTVTKNGISFTVSGVTIADGKATFAEGGYIQANDAATTEGSTCHGVIYYGMSMTGLSTVGSNMFAYTTGADATAAAGSGKTWFNMINNRGEGDNRGKYATTTDASTVTYTNITHDWSDQRDDNDSSGVWIELAQPRFTSTTGTFSVASLTFYYECQTTGKEYTKIYANEARGVFNITREDGTTRLPYSFEVGKPLTFKVTPTAAYSDYVFTVGWGHTKSMLDTDHTTILTPVSGVYTVTPDSTTLTSILVTYAKASYGVTFTSDAATISYTDSTGTALADQSGTYDKGSNVYFKLTYATGCHGGTVKVSDSALTADANGVYTISSIAAATTVNLVDPYYTLADTAVNFPVYCSMSAETSIVNTANGYAKSTKVVTTTANNPYTYPSALNYVPLAAYKEVRFCVYGDGTNYWMIQPWGDNGTTVADNAASWHEIDLKLEGTSFRLYSGGNWVNFTVASDSNLMDIYMQLSGSSGSTYYFSEIQGIKADTTYTSPYSVIAESPLASGAGTEDTTALPPFAPATKTYSGSYPWTSTDRACTSIDLTLYKEVLFYARDDDGAGWTSLRQGTTDLTTAEKYTAGVWAMNRLVLTDATNNTWLAISNNCRRKAVITATNFNELVYALNDSYHFSQVFGIAR
jgi:hypothetical protein